ncbi:MAG: GMC family oxidoreductase N-terminal domain-containing protein, partial [Myxococcales bacterium]|nr:GMC family oxidoreductase N-terminal domain-containing protein [Myxococcales bacterium]
MIHEGKDLAGENRTERADLVVVGTGPGGAVLAARCAEAGMRVVMLEQGPFLRAKDFNQREDDMTNRLVGRRGFHFSEDDGNLGLLYCETVGGTTVHFWADTPRVPDARLNEWADRFGLEGFRPDAFAAHYAHAEEGMHVERANDYQVNDNNRKVLAGARALGWACDRVPQARKNCVACGYCEEGCSYNRKQSMLVSYVPRATRAGAVLYSDARAETILTTADRRRALG